MNSYQDDLNEAHFYMRVVFEVVFLILGSILALMILFKMGDILFSTRKTIEPIDWSKYNSSKCEITEDKVDEMCSNGWGPNVKSAEVDKETGCITKVECGN